MNELKEFADDVQWGQLFYEPGIVEEHGVDFDPRKERLRVLGRTFGSRVRHRGVKLYVSGAVTRLDANMEMLKLIEMRGWKPREHWWQFWRPNFYINFG